MKPEQITAWALDEASAEERLQLEAALLENPQDKQKADETKAFCDFLLSELRDDSLALTDKQRERLKAQAAGVAPLVPAAQAPAKINGAHAPRPASRTAQTKWRVGVIVRLSLAACAVLGGFWTWQVYSEKQHAVREVAHLGVAEKPGVKVQLAPKPESKKEARLLTEAPKKVVVNLAPPAAKPLAASPAPAVVASSAVLGLKKDQRLMTPGDVTKLKQIQDQKAYALNFGDKMEAPAGVEMPVTQAKNAALLAAAPAPASSAVALSSGSLTQQSTSAMPLKGGGAVTVAAASDLPMAMSLAPDVAELNGFINLPSPAATSYMLSKRSMVASVDSLMGGMAMVDLTQSPEVTARSLVTPKPPGLGNCLVLRDQGLTQTAANGLPMTPAPSSLSAALGVSLADYRPSVAIGHPGLNVSRRVSLVLGAASGGTGSIVVQSGSPLMLSPFSQGWRAEYLSEFLSIGVTSYAITQDVGIGSSTLFMNFPVNPYLDNNSPGLLSFAKATDHSLSPGGRIFNTSIHKNRADADGLIKSGAGSLTLAGATSYTGATVVSGCNLNVSNPAASGLINEGDTVALGQASAASVETRAAIMDAGASAAAAPAQTTLDLNGGYLAATVPPPASSMAPGFAGHGMNDVQQLTLGGNANLGPIHTPENAGYDQIKSGWAAATTQLATSTTAAGVVQNPKPEIKAFVPGESAPPLVGLVMNSGAAVDQVQGGLLLAGSSVEVGNYDAAIGQYQDVLRRDPYNAAARRGMEAAERKRNEYFKSAYDSSRAKMLAQVGEKWEEQMPVPSASAMVYKDARTDEFYLGSNGKIEEPRAERQSAQTSGESYTRIIENEMKEVAREPLSTLSIDVDTASYANVRRFLNHNLIPPLDAVRIEELINYFPTAEEGPAHDAKEPFAVRVELAPCPWQPVHRLARIAIKGREMDKDRKASNLVFLVDVSGSMNDPAKLPLVQQSLRMLTEQLGEGDRVTIVVYAGSSGVVLPPTSGEKKAEILAAINKLSAGGSTHGSAGIKQAYEQAVAGFIKGGVNRVILCTDGDFNVGVSSPEELEKLIKHKAKTGVFLSVLGFGSGNLKDRTMETLADKGNGNYAYIDSLSEARKVLVEQMSGTLDTIAKDVKIQVEFNPAAVRSYRLLGYENRLLAKEDFNDDTKDAGEIGAGHSVVALYEVVPANLPAGAEQRPVVDSLKYQAPAISPAQLAEAAKSGETMTVKLRYKAPDSDLSKLIEVPTKDEGKTLTASTDEFKFSAAVAGFGLLLRDSSYLGNLSWETVRRLALDGKGADKLGYRGEFLQLIDKARGLKEAK